MSYYCEKCNYSASNSSNFAHHKKTQKHNKKVTQETNSIIEYPNSINPVSLQYPKNPVENCDFKCNICDKIFKHKNNYYRHKKNCENTKKDFNEIELKHKLELLTLKTEFLEKMEREKTELLTNFMNNANVLLNKTTDNNKLTTQALQNVSISALKYANDKFKDTPVLIPLDNFNINELSFENAEEKGQLTEILIYNAKQKSLDKLLGDHIIKYYKKDNPENQSFHSTDCSRLNYIVRELIENTPTWIVDKNGVKICKDIMKPLIKKCINALLDYQRQLLQKMGNGDYNKQKDVELIIDIIMSIDSGNLENDINKYIAPFFNLNKSLIN